MFMKHTGITDGLGRTIIVEEAQATFDAVYAPRGWVTATQTEADAYFGAPEPDDTFVTTAQLNAAIAATAGSSLTPTPTKTAAYIAAASDYVPVDTTGGGVAITLPTAPADKTQVGIKHVVRGGTNVVTIACGGSDVLNKTGGSTSATLTLLNQSAVFQYKASSGIWYVVGGDLPLSQLDSRYPVAGSVAPASLPSYAPTGLTKRYNPTQAAYNFTPATVGRTRAALARQEVNSPVQGLAADIRIIGHSIVQGGGGNAPRYVRAWPARLREMLTSRFGSAGTGLVPLNDDTDTDSRLVYQGGTWGADGTKGFGGRARTGVSGRSIYWPGVYCDRFNIYQSRRSDGGVVNAYVDQGATYGSGSGSTGIGVSGTETFITGSKVASARGLHSLRVDLYSNFTGIAVEGYLAGGGVKVSRLGMTGSKLASHLDATSATSALYAATMPAFDSASASPGPDCLMVMCLVNDVFNSGSAYADAAAYTAALGSAIATWKATASNPDVILVIEPPPQTSNSPTYNPSPTAGDWSLAKWQTYVAAMYSLAESSGSALLDSNALMTDWTTAFGRGLQGDSLHPTDAGHYLIAQALYEALVPGGSFKPNASAPSPYRATNSNTNPTTAYTLPDVDVATVHKITLNGNAVLTGPTLADGAVIDVLLKQDATGSRTVTWWGTVLWPGGTAPTLTTTAAKTDWFRFLCDGTNWHGEVVGQNL